MRDVGRLQLGTGGTKHHWSCLVLSDFAKRMQRPESPHFSSTRVVGASPQGNTTTSRNGREDKRNKGPSLKGTKHLAKSRDRAKQSARSMLCKYLQPSTSQCVHLLSTCQVHTMQRSFGTLQVPRSLQRLQCPGLTAQWQPATRILSGIWNVKKGWCEKENYALFMQCHADPPELAGMSSASSSKYGRSSSSCSARSAATRSRLSTCSSTEQGRFCPLFFNLMPGRASSRSAQRTRLPIATV